MIDLTARDLARGLMIRYDRCKEPIMTTVRTRVRVAPDHTISGVAPRTIPVGEHEAVISLSDAREAPKLFRIEDLPSRYLPWDAGVSLRREDLYGDDGR